jgi:AcrR family transcriptional regulator
MRANGETRRESSGRERRRDRMRGAILAEALAILREVGVEGIGPREVARRLDYSPAALYRYFDSREEIVAALAQESMALLRERLQAAAAGDRAAVAADRGVDPLIAVGEAYLAFAAQEPERFRLLFSELPSRRRSLVELPASDSPYQVVLDVVSGAIAEGRIAREFDVESAAFVLWSLVHGMAVLRSTHLRGFDADFDSLQRLALERLIASWAPDRGRGARTR